MGAQPTNGGNRAYRLVGGDALNFASLRRGQALTDAHGQVWRVVQFQPDAVRLGLDYDGGVVERWVPQETFEEETWHAEK